MTKMLIGGSPILNQEQLAHIGSFVLSNSKADVVKVQVRNTAKAVTRFANGRVMTSDSGNSLDVTITMRKGARGSVSVAINVLDDETLRKIVQYLDGLAADQPGPPINYFYVPDRPQKYLPASLWYSSTADSMGSVMEFAVPAMIDAFDKSSMTGSGGFIGLMSRAIYVAQKDGLTAYSRETDTECTVTARSSDGRASGWYGEAARDWSKVNPLRVAERAIEVAQRMKNPVAIEPGRRTVILSPYAVAQILIPLSRGFDAYITNVERLTVFTEFKIPGRVNKLGLRVFDPRINMMSSPTDTEGGYTPFGDIEEDRHALACQAMTYVSNGVLQDLAYHLGYALSEGKPFNQNPWSLRMEATSGTPLLTVEEMIARCEDGVYVQRLSSVDELDSITGVQTGVTQDGCFLVKGGKIDRPIKNFRYMDSPMYFLNRVIALGKAQRVALGFVPPASIPKYASEWPRRPMIVPPVMVRDFNFTALSDAI